MLNRGQTNEITERLEQGVQEFFNPDRYSHRGIFGIRKEDWKEFQSEDKLLHGNEDRYGIYQIRDDSVGRDYRFLGLNLVNDWGYVVNHADYQLMYSEELKPDETLDSLYYRFNEARPADFIGHSLSVSDVVVLNHGGDVQAFYVDSFGFSELPDFFKKIEAREHVTEFTSGLEVEGHVGSWHSIDQTEVSGEKFFLMEHDEYGDSVAGIVVNEKGKLVAEDVWNGFTTDVMDSIDEYLDNRKNVENDQEHLAESEKVESEKQENDITDEQETTVKDGKEEKPEKVGKADVETEVKDDGAPFTQVYMHDAIYARENGERDQYFASRRENVACREAIEKAVNENFDGMYLNGNAAKSVVARFGPERVEYVLATTVQQLDWDGRFSKNNKDWAKSIPTVEDLDKSGDDRRREYVVTSHPAVLDGFIRLARHEILEQEQTHEQE